MSAPYNNVMNAMAVNRSKGRPRLARVESAPAKFYPAILLRGPQTRRNAVKSARRNAANKRRLAQIKKATPSKLPKTRSARRNLIKKFPAAEAARQARANNAYEKMRQMNPSLPPRGLELAGLQMRLRAPPPPRGPLMSARYVLAMKRPFRSKK